jgi:nitrous oxidase accessory protein NosD
MIAPLNAWAAPRTFVKSTGLDTNACTLAAPCRNFGPAITAVDAGGEVVALDSASYPPFTVSKGVSVVAPPGIYAGISVAAGTGIFVNGAASDVVVLRGLTLTGVGGANGIYLNSAAALHVESCVISGFSGSGITGVAGVGEMYIKDTIVRDTTYGVFANAIKASIEHSRFERNRDAAGTGGTGVWAYGGAKVSVRDSEVTGGGSGFIANTGSSELNLRGVKASGAVNYGIACASTSVIRVADALVTGNGVGFALFETCVIESLGNNLVRGNTTNIAGTVTTVAGN